MSIEKLNLVKELKEYYKAEEEPKEPKIVLYYLCGKSPYRTLLA